VLKQLIQVEHHLLLSKMALGRKKMIKKSETVRLPVGTHPNCGYLSVYSKLIIHFGQYLAHLKTPDIYKLNI